MMVMMKFTKLDGTAGRCRVPSQTVATQSAKVVGWVWMNWRMRVT